MCICVEEHLCLRGWANPPLSMVGLVLLLGCSPAVEDAALGSGAGLQLAAADAGSRNAANRTVDVNRLSLESVVLAAQSGYYAKAAPGQEGALRGADLGWTFTHQDKIWIMYGDSWWLDPYNLQGRPDDAVGHISLLDFPDGASVDAFVAAHPAAPGQPAWRAAAPTMQVAMRPSGGFEPVISKQSGRQLPSGIGAVPIAAFSNGRSGAAEGVFAVFWNYELVACGNDGSCSDGYECDTGLGVARGGPFDVPCVIGSSSSCIAHTGLCQDRGTNRFDAKTDKGRMTSLPIRHAVGVTTSADPTHFETQPWATFRFYNSTGRTVSDFDPARAAGEGNDYTPAAGDSLPRSGVLLWGRPQFAGVRRTGRDLRLYLLWAPMPVPDRDMAFEWKPRYFSGLDSEQRAQFSERELDAQPLDLDAETPGDQPEELHDGVGQMNITWVPSLQQFVMFYGGESSGFAEGLLPWDDLSEVEHDPQGSMWVRFAAQPWGPWSAPRQLMAAGDRAADALPNGQYAEGGILAHNKCNTQQCARYDPAYNLDIGRNNNGVLYGPSFVDAWTATQGDTTALYWLLSTWNPYQTVLMKTTLRPL